jgi:hypothetical protein
MTHCHVPEDLNPKILVSWDVPPCSLVNSHGTLAAASYQTTLRYTPENNTLYIHCCKNPHFYTEWGKLSLWGEKRKTVVYEQKKNPMWNKGVKCSD